MFFELSNGMILNLAHVKFVPMLTGFLLIPLTMSDGTTLNVTKEEATKIRIHFRSLLINPS